MTSRTILKYFSIFHFYSMIDNFIKHRSKPFTSQRLIMIISFVIRPNFSNDRKHGLLKLKILLEVFLLPSLLLMLLMDFGILVQHLILLLLTSYWKSELSICKPQFTWQFYSVKPRVGTIFYFHSYCFQIIFWYTIS